MQKGFAHFLLLLFGLVAIISFAGAYYFNNFVRPEMDAKSQVIPYNPSPIFQKTEDSAKSYTNSQLGFEFAYAADFKVKEDTETEYFKRGNGDFRKNFSGYVRYEPAKTLGIVEVLDNQESFEKSPLSLWVFDNPDNLDAEKFYNKYWYFPFLWGEFSAAEKNKVAPTKEESVGGVLGKSAAVSYQAGGPRYIYINTGGKMYLFRVLAGGDAILKSFKFTGENLKTYKDARMEFKYPGDWGYIKRGNDQEITFFPPGSDPETPAPDLIFFDFSDTNYNQLPKDSDKGMEPFKQIVISGIKGRRTEDMDMVDGKPALSRSGGAPAVEEIQLPYKNGILSITAAKGDPVLEKILPTIVLK